MLSFYSGRALRNVPLRVLSAFPGAPPGTDKSHKGGTPWNSGVQRPRHARSLHLSPRLREPHIRVCVYIRMYVLCVLFSFSSRARREIFQSSAKPRVIGFQNDGIAGSRTGRCNCSPSFPNFGYQPVNGSLRRL